MTISGLSLSGLGSPPPDTGMGIYAFGGKKLYVFRSVDADFPRIGNLGQRCDFQPSWGLYSGSDESQGKCMVDKACAFL